MFNLLLKKVQLIWLVPLLLVHFSFAFKAKIIRISDGDTIVVEKISGEKVKIRIWGIDTPEKFYSSKLYREAKECNVSPELIHYLGKLASKYAHKYLYPGEIIEVIPKDKGRYGRLIGKIITNGKDFGLLMIKSGYSCVYWKTSSEEYIKAMKEAEKKQRGIWKIYPNVMKCLCY